jgi:hypothetical protein
LRAWSGAAVRINPDLGGTAERRGGVAGRRVVAAIDERRVRHALFAGQLFQEITILLEFSGNKIMIRNGLYLATTSMLDGVDAYNRHVMVLRDGTIRGGGPFFYTVGSFTCLEGKWKGEMTSQEHTPIVGTHPWARKVVSIGFTGTYSDDGAELQATALVGKRSFRFRSIYRLLVADD